MQIVFIDSSKTHPGSVRKLLGRSTMAVCTESWGLNKNESGADWMPAEWLMRCDLIWSVNPWTAHSCQYSALGRSSLYQPITPTSPSTPEAWTHFQQKWWLWPLSKHTTLWTLKAIHLAEQEAMERLECDGVERKEMTEWARKTCSHSHCVNNESLASGPLLSCRRPGFLCMNKFKKIWHVCMLIISQLKFLFSLKVLSSPETKQVIFVIQPNQAFTSVQKSQCHNL